MNSPIRIIDNLLNKFTMYKVIVWGLLALLAVAVIFAYSGLVAISGTGLLISIGLLGISTYAVNYVLAFLFDAQRNAESWLISALILACILPQTTTLTKGMYLLLAGAIAMVSKYVLAYHRSHIFNPAALAAFALSVTGLLPATWWVATPHLAPFTALLALIVLRKQRKFSMFAVFALVAVAMSLYVGVGLHSQELATVLRNGLLSLPLVFMGSIMLTEPTTLPPSGYYQILLAVLVGGVYASQLHIGHLSATPEAALMVAGIFSFAVAPAYGVILRLRSITQLTPNSYDLAFEKPARGFTFAPGQYMEWTHEHHKTDVRGNRRMFSIASSPGEAEVRIGTRHYQPSSSFKTALLAMKPGQQVRVAHVAGDFILPGDPATPLLLIAGGIGITPFRSMLQHLVDTKQQRDVVLLYTANTKEDFIYADTLRAAQAIGLQTHLVTDRLVAADIRRLVPDATKRTVYLSGPPAMVSGYSSLVKSLGVPRRRIRTDHFTGY